MGGRRNKLVVHLLRQLFEHTVDESDQKLNNEALKSVCNLVVI
jgi:hypothetical protein